MEYETIIVPSNEFNIISFVSYGELKEHLYEYKDAVCYPRMNIPEETDEYGVTVKYDLIIFDEKYRDIFNKCVNITCDGDFYTSLVRDISVSIICNKKDFIKFKIKEL